MVEATSQKAICFKHDAKISIFLILASVLVFIYILLMNFTSLTLVENATKSFYKFLCVITFDFDNI